MNFFYNFDEKINNFIYPISDSITGLIFWEISFFQNNLPLIVVWLVLASIFFTFYFRFINISAFSEGLKVAFGKYDKKSDPGEITPFQSFTAAMSGTIGLGNIAGVAVAISFSPLILKSSSSSITNLAQSEKKYFHLVSFSMINNEFFL